MLDLDQELRALVERPPRLPEPVETIRRRATRRRRRRHTVLLAAATIVAVTSVSIVLSQGHARPSITVPATPEDRLAGLAPGWHRLGAVPAAAVSPGALVVNAGFGADQAVWTGKELVIWDSGGNSGVSFDPLTGGWRRLPPSGLAHRASVVMAWTGREVLVWGGYSAPPGLAYYYNGNDLSGAGAATPYTDGAAYNPATDRWRRLPRAPVKPRLALGAVWTGREFIVSGGPPKSQGRAISARDVATDGAAYNPRSDTWRRIPTAPIQVTEGVVRWTGRELLVFGSLRTDFPDCSQCIGTDAQGALYNPTTNQWHKLPHPGVNEIGPTAAVADNQIIGTAGVLNPRRYKLGAPSWQNATGLHASPQEACYATLAAGKRLALLSDCGVSYWTFDTTTNRWANVPSPAVPFDQQPWGEPLWTGHAFVYWQTNPWLPGTTTSDPSHKDTIVWTYVP
jgi:hypothetical protein